MVESFNKENCWLLGVLDSCSITSELLDQYCILINISRAELLSFTSVPKTLISSMFKEVVDRGGGALISYN